MKKLEEIKIPDGFEREIIIIGNNALNIPVNMEKDMISPMLTIGLLAILSPLALHFYKPINIVWYFNVS